MNLNDKQRLLPEAAPLLGSASKLSLKARIAPLEKPSEQDSLLQVSEQH